VPDDIAFKGKQVSKVIITPLQLWVLSATELLCFKNSGLTSFSGRAIKYFKNKPIKEVTAGKNDEIWAIADNGSMWAFDDTVFKVKNNKITRYTNRNGLPQNIQQIYCDKEGLVWFSNRKGLCMLGDEYYEFNNIVNGRFACLYGPAPGQCLLKR